jgi:hypothetical protein
MLFRLPSNIGSNRATLYLGVATFFLFLVLSAPYVDKVLAKISYWFAI